LTLAHSTTEIVVLSKASGLRQRVRADLNASFVGQKAIGLVRAPPLWVPAFCCIATDLFPDLVLAPKREDKRASLTSSIDELAKAVGWLPTQPVYVRSSGVNEGLSERGRYVSKKTTVEHCASTLFELSAEINDRGANRGMSFIVQLAVEPAVLHGHLSNERRIADDTRDWVAEYFEPTHVRGVVDPFQIKNISKEKVGAPSDLACPYLQQIILRLREPARWATQNRHRIHFEWVWDGHRLWVVQADRVDETSKGGTPTGIPKVPHPKDVDQQALQVL
jgi:hypothetical protein